MLQQKFGKRYKIFLGLMTGGSVLFITLSFYAYQVFFTANVLVGPAQTDIVLLIPKNATFKQVTDSLNHYRAINENITFNVVAKLLKYHENVKPGRYIIEKQSTNLQTVRKLRAGNQEPTKLIISENNRLLPELPLKIAPQLALSMDSLAALINSEDVAKKYGFSQDDFILMFIPNTYEVYWTVTPQQLLDRMHVEYEKFWNDARLKKAQKAGLTPREVGILASIVDAETIHRDEKPRVAGVYMNRLKRNMKLEADPTVVFANGDFAIKRVLRRHLEIDSPYNTYKYEGLPPGPIRQPSISGLHAVLNYENHDYIFFCAKDDFSGYHAFAKTNSEHEANARRYHQALNKAGIK
ncbi:MAG: endolytic transglycosylase MltG [Bernardetiaceae bacterium]|nr:endolytic transglycosylase MltG [Bernardetiaceae bacterium]